MILDFENRKIKNYKNQNTGKLKSKKTWESLNLRT